MNTRFSIVLLASAVVLVSGFAAPANATLKCVIKVPKVGAVKKDDMRAITIKGSSKSDLIIGASDACFNAYQELNIAEHGEKLQDNDQGYSVANLCTNIADTCN